MTEHKPAISFVRHNRLSHHLREIARHTASFPKPTLTKIAEE